MGGATRSCQSSRRYSSVCVLFHFFFSIQTVFDRLSVCSKQRTAFKPFTDTILAVMQRFAEVEQRAFSDRPVIMCFFSSFFLNHAQLLLLYLLKDFESSFT